MKDLRTTVAILVPKETEDNELELIMNPTCSGDMAGAAKFHLKLETKQSEPE